MGSSDGEYITTNVKIEIQGKLDLADTDLTENLDLKDTPQKIWATIFDFLLHKSTQISGKPRFSGQKFGDRFFR